MQPDNLIKIKKLERQLTAAVVILFILVIGFLATYNSGSTKEALAISNNYNKNTTDNKSLNFSDWNNLPNDFVAKTGDTVSGNLIINGKVGINTNSPSHELTIKDTTGYSSIYIWGSGANAELALGDGTSHWAIYSDEINSDDLRFWRGSNRMVITDDGKVGIGTDNPDIYNLAVVGQTRLTSPAGQLRLTNNSSWKNVDFTVNSDGKLDIEGGNVGIGTANPQAKLDVAGDIAMNGRSYIKTGATGPHAAGASWDSVNGGKDIFDLKTIVGSAENAKKCLTFVISVVPEYGGADKGGALFGCRVDSQGWIDAFINQDANGDMDGWINCGYVCAANASANIDYRLKPGDPAY